MAGDEQIFFRGDYQKRINAPIITTGNELVKQEIADFSKELNLDELYHYIGEVKDSTEVVLESLSFDDMKKKDFGRNKRESEIAPCGKRR